MTCIVLLLELFYCINLLNPQQPRGGLLLLPSLREEDWAVLGVAWLRSHLVGGGAQTEPGARRHTTLLFGVQPG